MSNISISKALGGEISVLWLYMYCGVFDSQIALTRAKPLPPSYGYLLRCPTKVLVVSKRKTKTRFVRSIVRECVHDNGTIILHPRGLGFLPSLCGCFGPGVAPLLCVSRKYIDGYPVPTTESKQLVRPKHKCQAWIVFLAFFATSCCKGTTPSSADRQD